MGKNIHIPTVLTVDQCYRWRHGVGTDSWPSVIDRGRHGASPDTRPGEGRGDVGTVADTAGWRACLGYPQRVECVGKALRESQGWRSFTYSVLLHVIRWLTWPFELDVKADAAVISTYCIWSWCVNETFSMRFVMTTARSFVSCHNVRSIARE